LSSIFRKTLFRALQLAGARIRRDFDKPIKARFKNNSSINLVTAADQAADRIIRRTILQQFPSHDLLTEESVPTGKGSPYKWIVDPLDGTTNYAHHYPQVGVSIGLEFEGKIILGGVYDPFRDELFWAEKGKGAWLRSAKKKKRIHISAVPRLKSALLMTGFPYDRRERIDLYLSYVKAFMAHIQGIRRAGAAALDLCWVACGRVDGYWEWRLKPWDVAAGKIIVEEAGGQTSDFAGNALNVYGEQTLVTNGKIHAEMLDVMRRLVREQPA
jgi:myo-inositol-1(or 4)-monophosphatase